MRFHLQLPNVIPHILDLVEFLVELIGLLAYLEELVGCEGSDLPELSAGHHGKLRQVQAIDAMSSTARGSKLALSLAAAVLAF